MHLTQENEVGSCVEKIGYVFAYLVFTTVLYLILVFMNGIPSMGHYFHIAFVTFSISVLSIIVKRLLK